MLPLWIRRLRFFWAGLRRGRCDCDGGRCRQPAVACTRWWGFYWLQVNLCAEHSWIGARSK